MTVARTALEVSKTVLIDGNEYKAFDHERSAVASDLAESDGACLWTEPKLVVRIELMRAGNWLANVDIHEAGCLMT